MNDPYLVEAEWLLHRIDDANLAIIECSWSGEGLDEQDTKAFEAGHIPGALRGRTDRLVHGGVAAPRLPSPEVFAAAMAEFGMERDRELILYSRDNSAAYCWWLCRQMGHERVRVLNGGWRHWLQIGAPVATGTARCRFPAASAETAVDWHLAEGIGGRHEIASWQDVLEAAHGDQVQIFDARSVEEFHGLTRLPGYYLPSGHLTGAVHLPWQTLLRDHGDYRFVEREEAAAVFEAVGRDTRKPAIFVCGTGIDAAVLAFQAARLGQRNWQIYDGGWCDWTVRFEGPAPGRRSA